MNIIKWIKSKWWWLPYYRRETLSDKEAWKGRCVNCYASYLNKGYVKGIPYCGRGNNCPCKMNQHLILRKKYLPKRD